MIASAPMVAFSPMELADRLTRAQCLSRSGITPSKMRAPSKTEEPSQAACERGPMIGGFPSCQAPSNQFQVCEYQATALSFGSMLLSHRNRCRAARQWLRTGWGMNGFDGSRQAD